MNPISKISSLGEWLSSSPQAASIHMGADLLIAIAYYSLAAVLIFFLKKRHDLTARRSFFFFAIFLLLAGILHTLNLWAPWYRIYGIQVAMKFLTAAFSIITGILLWRLIPKALILPSPQRIDEAEERLRMSQQELESIAEKKRRALAEAGRELDREKAMRRDLETLLREMEDAVALMPSILQAIGDTADFYTTLEITIRKVCEALGWDYGEAWVPQGERKVLECCAAWYGPASMKEFRRVSQELRFPEGLGLPGRVWASKAPLWIQDISAEKNSGFLHAQLAQEVGIKAASGVPVLSDDGKVLSVLVFFLLDPKERDKRLLELVSAVASQVGSVIQRKRTEEKLQEAHELMERRVRERTEELTKANKAFEAEISERILREESVRKSQENFQTLVNSIEGIVWEFDLRIAKFTFISQQSEKILGYPVESWFNESSFWQDHIHGGDRDQAVAFRARAAKEKRDDQFEYRMITSEGQTIWLRDMVTVVVVDEEAIKLRGVMVNITERKQAEEALNQERNFVSTVLDTASAMVIILDTEGRIVRFNRACEQISGYSAEEVKHHFFWDLFSIPDEVEKIKKIFSRLLAGQFPTNYESSWVAKDGTKRAIAWSNTALLNRYSSVVHVIATGIDITLNKDVEQKLKEAISNLARSNAELDKSSQELREANERLKKLDEMKSNFISAASHELRTPLTSLKGYVETILQEEAGPINEKQREFLSYVKESTDRLHRLLNELLDISKIESGQAEMHRDLTPLRDLLKEEIMIFKPQADEKEIFLILEIEEGLRAICCDADKIREVMDNLISNAVKYTPRRGKIRIQARNQKEGIQIDVQDTGIGIKKDDQTRIFEPFQHIEKDGTDSEREESTGLGLTLAKKIIEAHEGEIFVKSEEGKGSTFTILLPVGNQSHTNKTHWAMIRE